MGSTSGYSGNTTPINFPRHAFYGRQYVSYLKLNPVTRPFTFPIPRFDDLVKDIVTELNYFIAVDMDSGNW